MENKKPLIIVPPMSEPMKKLKEILEGIATEENIDIFEVEDAKEFGQLLGSGGQSLVMMSNAKLCATLLQENRASIIKNNIKVILLTPKEIPQKTLVKFTKVGLTEAILENSPPKTLLYKVKLLLRSIKAKVKEETAQQVVKSMLDMNAKLNTNEGIEAKESDSSSSDGNEENLTNQKTKFSNDDDGEKLDYLSNLKGKKKQAEDVIDTHWKSKRNNGESVEIDIENPNSKKEVDYDDIDNYYRGKSKKSENVEIEPDEIEKKMREVIDETESNLFNRKKVDETELDLDPIDKPKMREIAEEEEDQLLDKKNNIEDTIQDEPSKKEKELEKDLDIDDLKEKLIDELMEENSSDKKRNKSETEDLGGHYKGKIKKQNEDNESDDFQDEKDVDTVSENEDDVTKKEEIENETETDEIERPKLVDDSLLDEKDPSKAEVDHIDGYLRGKLGKNVNLDLDIEIGDDTRSKNEDIEDNLDPEKEKIKFVSEDEDLDEHKKREFEEEIDSDDLKREKLIEDLEDNDFKREALLTEQEEGDKDRQLSEKIEEADDGKLNNDTKTKLLEDADEFNHKESGEKVEESELERKNLNQSKLNLAPGDEKNIHEGQTDHISTYYKSGDIKEKDHDWNLKHDKKETVKLDILKNIEDESVIALKKKADYGETTIDYRKLKEEFDLISRGEDISSSAVSSEYGSDLGKNYNSEDQYKVVEVRPSALLFSVELLNLIYMNDSKGIDFIRLISEKLWKSYNGILVINKINSADQKYQESYNAFIDMGQVLDQASRDFWEDYKKDQAKIDDPKTYSMPHFICREIIGKDGYWKDLELAPLSESDTLNKPFEYVYPFYDGVSKMGHAQLFLNKGVKKIDEMDIVLTIEFLRSALLENFSVARNKQEEEAIESPKKESKVMNLFGSLFKKNAG